MEQRKAIILYDDEVQNAGEVVNIIVCDERGAQGFRLPINQTLWDCTNVPVAIGDRWADGVFSRNGEPVSAMPSTEQQLAAQQQIIDEQSLAILSLMDAVITMQGGQANV